MHSTENKKVIIIGATSGIGKELALQYATKGYSVGITGRRETLLSEMKEKFPSQIFTESFDVRDEKNIEHLNSIPVTDIFIEEIKSTRKKLKAEDGKQKEQSDIIDQFIKIQPSIKAKTKPVVEAVDLSENNLTHTDKFVSETLVEILMKQGKTEKAIEVLKKLIWKFPQKKAYFAARIEDLRK